MRSIVRILTMILACFLLGFRSNAQVEFGPVVLDANGQAVNTSWGSLSYSIGETVVFTGQDSGFNFWLTQGFQQPDFGIFSDFTVHLSANAESCFGRKNGSITAVVTGGSGGYKYTWSSLSGGPLKDSLSSLDSLSSSSLSSGETYFVTVSDTKDNSATASVVLPNAEVKCGEILIFKGFTPNGDGHNDTWFILGIDLFASNEVSIFDRWGVNVWNGTNYDNTSVVWGGQNHRGEPLPDATYFYVIKYNNIIDKGWVQITR